MLDSISHPSRLHLLYEIFPMAFLIEKAGGKSSDGTKSVLNIKIENYEQKISFVAGSQNDVDKIVQRVLESKN